MFRNWKKVGYNIKKIQLFLCIVITTHVLHPTLIVSRHAIGRPRLSVATVPLSHCFAVSEPLSNPELIHVNFTIHRLSHQNKNHRSLISLSRLVNEKDKQTDIAGGSFACSLLVQSATSPIKSVIIKQPVFISVLVYFPPNSELSFLFKFSSSQLKLKVAHRSNFVSKCSSCSIVSFQLLQISSAFLYNETPQTHQFSCFNHTINRNLIVYTV